MRLSALFFALVSSLFLSSAAHAEDAEALRAMELSYLRAAVSPDLFPYAHIEIPALENLKVFSEGGHDFLGLRTYYGQKLKNNGVRAEVSVDYPYQEGETIVYTWRLKLPDDFVSDAPANRWWLFADWHDQPNAPRGETWDGYPSHSPAVAIGYGQLNGQDTLAFVYGAPNPQTIGTFPFTRGQWHTLSLDVTWSRGDEGHAALYLDNMSAPVLTAVGPNMYNDYQQYMKLGSYRHPEIKGDAWVFLSDLKISKK